MTMCPALSTIVSERLATLDNITLHAGNHEPDGEMCLLEAAAWLAGEPWSDYPACVDPVIAAFGRAWNDGLPDNEARDRLLKPFLPRIIGTAGTGAITQRRASMVVDWLVRNAIPAALRVAELNDHADRLAALAPLDSIDAWMAAQADLNSAASAANAAWAAWDAWDAWNAWATSIAWTAWAAWAARTARIAWTAWAAWTTSAARQPTVEALQASACDLLDRMITLTEGPLS